MLSNSDAGREEIRPRGTGGQIPAATSIVSHSGKDCVIAHATPALRDEEFRTMAISAGGVSRGGVNPG
jgi:hypothetical protein